jgi:glutamate-1-semialdehyde 2,1-aminomutase
MAAGIATLRHLIDHQDVIYAKLEATTAAIADGVAALASEAGVPLTTNRVGSMFTWFFTSTPVTDFDTAATSDTAAFARFHRAMLDFGQGGGPDTGVWLPPSQYEAAFVGTAHGPEEVELLLAAARHAFAAEE